MYCNIDTDRLTALHEAGHAIVLLEHGVPVKRMWIGDGTGATVPEPDYTMPADAAVLLALAGGIAESVLGGVRGQPSKEDEVNLAEAVKARGIMFDRAKAERETAGWVASRSRRIEVLALELKRRRQLERHDFAALFRRLGYPFTMYAQLYHDRAPSNSASRSGPTYAATRPAKRPVRFVGPRIRLASGEWAEWSEASQCHLGPPRKPLAGLRLVA
ncbi:MAG: hypothetical protein L0Y72_23590 [Gemmataceae bacterium]|nr:hypothetical protein [Gemmataceae bacterium]MCI0742028.1 hypothetical protein [Gemmataceae bacterium]